MKTGKLSLNNEVKKFNPNDKGFGEDLLKHFQKSLSKNTTTPVKMGWIKKDDDLPLITITKSMDEIQKLYKNRIVSFDFNIWTNNKLDRDSVTRKVFSLIENINFGNNFSVKLNKRPLTIEISLDDNSKFENKVEISSPQIINFEEKKGIYRCQFSLTMHVKVNVNNKELQTLKDRENKAKFLDTLVLGKFDGVGGEFIESKNKEYILFRPSLSKNVIAFIKNNKVVWKADLGSIWCVDMANDGSYAIAVGSLTKKEMSSGYKSGGHIYLINRVGKIKDIKIPCDGLSCSISPDNKNFGATSMGPEWGVYYFDNKGNNIWKKIFDKRVGGIELATKQIILYDKMHKETRKVVIKLDNNGNIIKR